MTPHEFEPTFLDSQNLKCEVKLSLSTVRKFAKECKLPLDGFVPGQLSYDEMLTLCYMGIKHHAELRHMTLDEVCDERLDGEAFARGMEATTNAMVNFTLGQMKEPERIKLAAQIRANLPDANSESEGDSEK